MSTHTLSSSLPSVFEYTDYRHFLRDLYLSKKESRSGYSYRRFAADLGFSASNHIHLIISGKRHLSQDGVDKLKHYLRWSAQQKKFFEHLLFLARAETTDAKVRHQIELDKILGKRRKMVHPDQYLYFSTWYIPVLRELFALKTFTPTLTWMMQTVTPAINKSQIKDGLDVLKRLGMIVKDGTRFRQSAAYIATLPELTSDMVHHYHKALLKLSMRALNGPADERDISLMTISLSKTQFAWLKQRMADFRSEIEQELQTSDELPTQVVQLNLQLFPVTRSIDV